MIVTITLTTRAESNEYDLFPEMKDAGYGRITAIDEKGNCVDLPENITKGLLSWAGYDV